MTRLLYGVTPGDVIAVVASDPTTANPSHQDFGPIAGTVQIWTADRSAQETDLLSVNLSTLAAGSAIASGLPSADAKGRIPFYGKDGYTGAYWAKDGNGDWWLLNPSDLAARGVASTNISDATATGRAVLTATDAPTARTAIGAGTSSLAIGTTSTTAKAGNYAPDLTPYATKAGTTRQFADVSTTAPNSGYINVFDGGTQKWIPADPTTQFAGVDGAGRLLPQNRTKYDLDLVVINPGDPIPSDVQTGALVWQRPATTSLIPILEGSNFASASSSTLTFTNADAYAVGDWIGFAVLTSGETTAGTLPTLISSITPASGAYGTLTAGPESVQSGTVQVDLKYAKVTTAIAAGVTHTLTLNQARIHKSVIMFKLPGIAASAPLDQSTNNQGGSQTTLDLSVGPTGSMALTPEIGILVTGHNDGNGTVTRVVSGTNGWNLLSAVESDNGGSSRTLNVLYKQYANATATPLLGTVHVTASDGSTGAYTMVVASFKAA